MNIENLKNMPVVGQPAPYDGPVTLYNQAEYDALIATHTAAMADASAILSSYNAEISALSNTLYNPSGPYGGVDDGSAEYAADFARFNELQTLMGPASAEMDAAGSAIAELERGLEEGSIVIASVEVVVPVEGGEFLGAAVPQGTAIEQLAEFVQGSNTVIKSQAANNVTRAEEEDLAVHKEMVSEEQTNFDRSRDNESDKNGALFTKIESDKQAVTDSANALVNNPDDAANSIDEFVKQLSDDVEDVNDAIAKASKILEAQRNDFRAAMGTAEGIQAILVDPVFPGGVA